MEKRTRTNGSKAKDFLKKNMYYLIMAVCLIAVATMITLTLINKDKDDIINPPDAPAITDPVIEEPVDTDPDPVDNKPVVTPIVFASPVNNVNLVMDYTEDQLVHYVTLNHFAVHQALDFAGNEGDKVYAVYGGVVESIDYNPLYGTVVTIKHSDKLKTVYMSLAEQVSVTTGQNVLKGMDIGTMGRAGFEYSAGPHLHFEVYENGELVSPYTYLSIGDK